MTSISNILIGGGDATTRRGPFTVVATLIYHFPPTGGEYYAFMKNLTATGSLLLLSTLFLN